MGEQHQTKAAVQVPAVKELTVGKEEEATENKQALRSFQTVINAMKKIKLEAGRSDSRL